MTSLQIIQYQFFNFWNQYIIFSYIIFERDQDIIFCILLAADDPVKNHFIYII